MNINKKWASGLDGEGNPAYAPADQLTINGRIIFNPTDKHYKLFGYFPVVDEQPAEPAPDGKHYEAKGWVVQDDTVKRVYELVDDPSLPPRRWSRLSIKTALAQASALSAAKEYLQAVEIADGYSAWEALTDCDYIEEGYPNAEKWNAILDGAAAALGKTRDEIDAFLDAVPTEN